MRFFKVFFRLFSDSGFFIIFPGFLPEQPEHIPACIIIHTYLLDIISRLTINEILPWQVFSQSNLHAYLCLAEQSLHDTSAMAMSALCHAHINQCAGKGFVYESAFGHKGLVGHFCLGNLLDLTPWVGYKTMGLVYESVFGHKGLVGIIMTNRIYW